MPYFCKNDEDVLKKSDLKWKNNDKSSSCH
jgi:hypothetical protein